MSFSCVNKILITIFTSNENDMKQIKKYFVTNLRVHKFYMINCKIAPQLQVIDQNTFCTQ